MVLCIERGVRGEKREGESENEREAGRKEGGGTRNEDSFSDEREKR